MCKQKKSVWFLITPNVLTKTIIFKQHKRKLSAIEETTRCECAYNQYKHIFVVSET